MARTAYITRQKQFVHSDEVYCGGKKIEGQNTLTQPFLFPSLVHYFKNYPVKFDIQSHAHVITP
jgi:hypothetical protein